MKLKQKGAVAVYEKFLNTLTEEQKVEFEEVLDKLFGLEAERTQTDYYAGFKLGLLVAFDALYEGGNEH